MNVIQYKLAKDKRFFFLVSGLIIWIGIWFTGFETVHWLLYVPAVTFIVAVISGYCPGLIISKLIFKDR
ncbi:MAG: hypothetical protein H8E64_02125 [Candidatus Marinimicrobia bacterium]|nr:hypothetical protein [Candidatus Neomarinimicrobiota bacterium]